MRWSGWNFSMKPSTNESYGLQSNKSNNPSRNNSMKIMHFLVDQAGKLGLFLMIVPYMLVRKLLAAPRESTCERATLLMNCLNMLVQIGFLKFKILRMKNRAVLQFIAGRNKSMKKSQTCEIANHALKNEHLQSSIWHLILSEKYIFFEMWAKALPVPLIKKIVAQLIMENRAKTITTMLKSTTPSTCELLPNHGATGPKHPTHYYCNPQHMGPCTAKENQST